MSPVLHWSTVTVSVGDAAVTVIVVVAGEVVVPSATVATARRPKDTMADHEVEDVRRNIVQGEERSLTRSRRACRTRYILQNVAILASYRHITSIGSVWIAPLSASKEIRPRSFDDWLYHNF